MFGNFFNRGPGWNNGWNNMNHALLNKLKSGLSKAGSVIKGYTDRIQQRKYYLFLKCPKCNKTLRLPKNKGKLQVTCPVCKFEFLKKT